MKKHILIIFLLSIVTLSAFGQAGSQSISVLRSRVNDSTTVNGAHASGYGDIYFNNQRAQPAWLWWDAATSTYRTFGSGSGGGWATTGVQTLTGPFGVESADSIGIASTDQINIRSSADNFLGFSNGDYTQGSSVDHAFVGTYKDATTRSVYQSVAEGGVTSTTGLQAFSTGVSSFGIYADTLVYRTGNNVKRFKIDPNGSWHLGTDPGTAGDVLQSNGAGAAPTWVAPSGGGGATAAGATGNIQYKSAGGGLQAEAALTYDSATNTLTVANIANAYTSLTDGAAITVTGSNHTLTSTQATVTWTLSQTGNYSEIWVVLNATGTTWTFPANTLCVGEGAATGNNIVALSGVSGDNYVLVISKNGSNYRVTVKNYAQ